VTGVQTCALPISPPPSVNPDQIIPRPYEFPFSNLLFPIDHGKVLRPVYIIHYQLNKKELE
jgi:hypothetical protein